MRPRKWVLIAAFIVISLVIAFFTGKRALEKNRNLEHILTRAVSAAIKGPCTVGAVRIGFFSVYLHDVSVTLPLQSVGIRIRTIKAGLSFSKLVLHRGDITRAINQIILIKPAIDLPLYLPEPPESTATVAEGTSPIIPQPADFAEPPVRFLYIKKGTVRLNNRKGDTVNVAGDLSGNLSSSAQEVSFNLTGKAGAPDRNLSVQGSSSSPNNRHHLSVRLSGARLGKPFSAGNVTVRSGILNGTVECTFNNRLDPDSLELHGWVRLTDGNARQRTPDLSIDSLLAAVSFEKNTCRIDTVSGWIRGMRCSAQGTVTCSRQQTIDVAIDCSPFIPDSLYGLLPPEACDLLSGTGSASVQLQLRKGRDPTIAATAGGFALGTLPLHRLDASCRISGTTLIADSLSITTPLFNVDMQGYYDLDTSKNDYDLSFSLSADTFPDTIGLQGSLQAMGTITGSAVDTPVVNCRLAARDLQYNNFSLGNPQMVVLLKNKRCTFNSVDIDTSVPIAISGSIDSLLSDSPFARFTLSIGSQPIKEQLMRMHGMPTIDSLYLKAKGSGWISDFSAAAELIFASRDFSGELHAAIDRSPRDTGAFIWNLTTRNTRYKKLPVTINGTGRLVDTCIYIDTITALGGISGKAKIYHTLQPPRLQAAMSYHMPLAELMQLISGNPDTTVTGILQGTSTVSGTFESLATRSDLTVRNAGTTDANGYSADLKVVSEGTACTIFPVTVFRGSSALIVFDTISTNGKRFNFTARFSDLTPAAAGSLLSPDHTIDTRLSGELHTTGSGFPIVFSFSTPSFTFDDLRLDSLRGNGSIAPEGLTVSRCTFRDGTRTRGTAQGYLPWAFLGSTSGERDTLFGEITLKGNLLATIEKNIQSPIGGSGHGTADIAFFATGGNWTFTRGDITLPHGLLKVRPFVLDNVKNFTFHLSIDSSGGVHTDMNGTIKRKPIRIFSTHNLPDGYEPLMIGPLNFGAFQVETPKKGVDLHLPGFMALRERGGIEFRGRGPFDYFTISGPLDRLKITGTWILRDLEFTFPFLPFKELNLDFDPFPYVTWEMDLKPGNRKAMYFWDLASKRGRILRFVEGFLDLSSHIKVRGRDFDKTFRIYGSIRSYKGAVYYGRVFDRNFNVGVEFNPIKPDKHTPYNIMPILWGSAEAFADTSRFDRIKLTCMVVDPVTGAVSEKARLADQPTPNITFHLSSDFEELPGESEREYYRQAGITFSTISGAGSAVSNFGEQLFHRYLLQRWERKLARKLGLDVMNIESSIVSNYFSKLYSRQFDGWLNDDDYLALANVGVTVGRYFFRDFLLVKARGELIPIDMDLTPEYSIGFEFQPSQYLTMDLNYGFHMSEAAIQHSPLLMMQLRLPITRLRNLLHF